MSERFRFTGAQLRQWRRTVPKEDSYDAIAAHANALLDEHLSKCTKVSGHRAIDEWMMTEMIVGKAKPGDTHTALLMNVEEIKK